MTSTAPEAAASTTLTPVSAARIALAKKGRNLVDVLRAVHSGQTAPEPEVTDLVVAPQAPLPVKVVTGQDVRDAFGTVLTKVGAIKWPTQRAKLTTAQKESMADALSAIKDIEKWLKEVKQDSLRPAWFNHFDVIAEETGKVDEETLRDKDGFYVLPASEKVSTGATVKREPRRGAVDLTEEALLEAYEAGDLSKADYLAMTRQTRVVDEEGVLTHLTKNPHLANVIKKYSAVKASSVGFNLR